MFQENPRREIPRIQVEDLFATDSITKAQNHAWDQLKEIKKQPDFKKVEKQLQSLITIWGKHYSLLEQSLDESKILWKEKKTRNGVSHNLGIDDDNCSISLSKCRLGKKHLETLSIDIFKPGKSSQFSITPLAKLDWAEITKYRFASSEKNNQHKNSLELLFRVTSITGEPPKNSTYKKGIIFTTGIISSGPVEQSNSSQSKIQKFTMALHESV